MSWVAEGGHLMVAAEPLSETHEEREDLLLARLDVTYSETLVEEGTHEAVAHDQEGASVTASEGEAAVAESDRLNPYDRLLACTADRREDPYAYCQPWIDDKLITIRLNPDLDSGELFFSGSGHLKLNLASDEVGRADPVNPLNVIQLDYGQGEITLISSDQPWRNQWIQLFDHAYILKLIVADAKRILISEQIGGAPYWTTLFWQAAWPFIISMGVLVWLYLWKKSVRIGPIRVAATLKQRDIVEHIDASAQFFVKQLEGEPIIKAIQQEIRQLLQTRYGISPIREKDYVWLAERLSTPTVTISDKEVAQTMQPWYQSMREEDRYQTIVLLKKIKDIL